eukprot:1926958-Rhodomonas_salina.4
MVLPGDCSSRFHATESCHRESPLFALDHEPGQLPCSSAPTRALRGARYGSMRGSSVWYYATSHTSSVLTRGMVLPGLSQGLYGSSLRFCRQVESCAVSGTDIAYGAR